MYKTSQIHSELWAGQTVSTAARGLCRYGLLQLRADCSQGHQQKWDAELGKGKKTKQENRLSCTKAVVINKCTSGTTAVTILKTWGMSGVILCGIHSVVT